MAGHFRRQRSHTDYTVACICPMGVELAPVEGMLDEIHDAIPTSRDQNVYTLGEICGHNVVVAVMPEIGNNAAATVATQLLNDFPSIRFSLLVGIGGGVPGTVDVRLGDVVVSQPTDTFGGVVQYDMGKKVGGGLFQRTGLLVKPPAALRSYVRKLESQHRRMGHNLSKYILEMIQKYPAMQAEYSFPSTEQDQLFNTSYAHQSGSTCEGCDQQQTISRSSRPSNESKIYYGTIGSANAVIKDAVLREELRRDMNILCVEMEAAGLMSDFPCLVIRGICDYADSHKNKKWQPYAAAVAAAYMKDLLLLIPASQTPNVECGVASTVSPFQLGLRLGEAPVIQSELFVGRLPQLNEMERILQPHSISSEQRRIVLGGLGGIGKTQLAIAYATQYRDCYDSIFWLNATSEAVLKDGVRVMAQQVLDVEKFQGLQGEQFLLYVSRWLLDPQNPRWLLIFDNYDEPERFDLLKHCPHGAHGSIIVTTRSPDQVAGHKLLVPRFEDTADGLRILESRSQRYNTMSDVYALRLVERMQGLPLALATAGAHLSKSTWTFERYLQEYERRWNVNPRRPLQLREYRDRTLYTTWNLSYQRLKDEDADAAQLLKLLAYFDNQHIWFDLLHAGLTADCPTWLISLMTDSVDFESVMGLLADYHFIEVQTTTQTYSMHACVHDWTLAGLNDGIDSWCYWYAFDCIATRLKHEDWDSLGQLQYARLASHAVRLTCTNFNEAGTGVSIDRIEGAECILQLLEAQYHFKAAEIIYLRVLTVSENALGLNHPTTLDIVNNLGLMYWKDDRLDEAEQMCIRALAAKEEALGVDHVSTLRTVNNLGILYWEQDKLDEAEQMYLRALPGFEGTLGEGHVLTLGTVNNLGVLYRHQRKLDEAEQMLLRALAEYGKSLGPDHITTLEAAFNIGLLYVDQGKPGEAEQMYQQALAGYQRTVGSVHMSTLDALCNIGLLYADQNKLDEAEHMLQQALAGYQKTLGDQHSKTRRVVEKLDKLDRARAESTVKEVKQ